MQKVTTFAMAALAFAAAGEGLPTPREPFAKAHIRIMARAEAASQHQARLAEIDVWAEGSRLRARVRNEPQSGELWIDGLAAEPLRMLDGKVAEPQRRTLEAGLKTAFSTAPSRASACSTTFSSSDSR